jgi:hypothetical protein
MRRGSYESGDMPATKLQPPKSGVKRKDGCEHDWRRFYMTYPTVDVFWRTCRKCGERRG